MKPATRDDWRITMKTLKVILNRPRTMGHFILFARFIASRMQGNPYFPSPTVPIATLAAHIAELEAALTLSQRNTVKARDAAFHAVLTDLTTLAVYVQTVAQGRPLDAVAIVASAGMSIKQFPGPGKATFVVKQGKLSGTVTLVVRHPGRVATFYWQRSSDGTTWIDEEDGVVANTTIQNLTPGAFYWFRYRLRTSKGLGEWSQPFTLLVV
jgi:hypothetical protein